jgi:soluble lytic murein transglycosylase-like protein
MVLRDCLAGVAAAALLGFAPAGIAPAAAQQQAPRSLFEALPAPAAASPVPTGLQRPAGLAKTDRPQAKVRAAKAPPANGQADKAPADKPTKTASAADAPLSAQRPLSWTPTPAAPPQEQAAGSEGGPAERTKGRKPLRRAKADARALPAPEAPAALPSPLAPAPAASAPLAATPAPEAKPLSRAERRKTLREAREAKKQQTAGNAAAESAPPAQATPTFASNPFMTLFGALPAQTRGEALPAVSGRPEIDRLVAYHARLNHVPESLVHRVIVRESKYNPRAVGRGGAMGLMQIKTATARGVGYTGGPAGLLDAETNLTYGIKYLAGAWRVAGGSHDRAVSHYARGYYYEARRRGLAGPRRRGEPEPTTAAAATPQAPTFFSLFTRQAAAQ